MGCEEKTPVLARFSAPAGEKEIRCLEGLYLDKPEVGTTRTATSAGKRHD